MASMLGNGNWSDLDKDLFLQALFSSRIYVLSFEGMDWHMRDRLHKALKTNEAYLGAIRIDETNQVHWSLYNQDLIPFARIVGNELRLFYQAYEGEAAKDIGMFNSLSGLAFDSVTWEDLAGRGTIFDTQDTFERANRRAELDEYLSQHLGHVADDVLIRLADLEPKLPDILYAALRTFQITETSEDIAQVCCSCRRLLTGLADALFPARDSLVNGRKVGNEQYINRLWVYVDEKLKGDQRALMVSQVKDIGTRIDKINELANKGLHSEIIKSDLHRLISALIIFAYDILALESPHINPETFGPEDIYGVLGGRK